jgi:hypothetical protein
METCTVQTSVAAQASVQVPRVQGSKTTSVQKYQDKGVRTSTAAAVTGEEPKSGKLQSTT